MTKSTKRNVIVSAVLAIVMCMSLMVGGTFAIFTSDSKVNIAVTSGKVDVTATISDLTVYSPTSISMEESNSVIDSSNAATSVTTVNNVTSGSFVNGGTATLKGGTLTLDRMTPGDKVTFKITVTNNSTVKVKYRTRVSLSADDGLYTGLRIKIGDDTGMAITKWAELEPSDTQKQVKELECEVELPTTAGNEYQDKSCTLSYIVEAVQSNAEAVNDIACYTLDEFNALEAIPAGIKNVYLSIGTVSLKEGSVIIGNENLRDKYERNATGGTTYTDKEGINLYIVGGTIKDGPDVDNTVTNKIAFKIPDKSIVTFNYVKIEGFFGLTSAGEDNPCGTPMHGKVASVTFDGCTFDALWLQNGGFYTEQITIKNSTFNKHENSEYAGNTNPLWFKNIGQNGTNIVIDKCVFNTNRPVKVVEGDVKGQTVSITNCTFNMESDSENKNAAIMFSQTSNGSTLGNVVVSGNEVNGGVSLLTFYNPCQITMADEATFRVYDNVLNGAKLSVVWKSATEFTPDFMKTSKD